MVALSLSLSHVFIIMSVFFRVGAASGCAQAGADARLRGGGRRRLCVYLCMDVFICIYNDVCLSVHVQSWCVCVYLCIDVSG